MEEEIRKNSRPIINVQIGVEAFKTAAILLLIFVSLKAIKVQGKAELSRPTMISIFHGIWLNCTFSRRMSMITSRVRTPKRQRRNVIDHGPKLSNNTLIKKKEAPQIKLSKPSNTYNKSGMNTLLSDVKLVFCVINLLPILYHDTKSLAMRNN
jgi:hypothetical protein